LDVNSIGRVVAELENLLLQIDIRSKDAIMDTSMAASPKITVGDFSGCY